VIKAVLNALQARGLKPRKSGTGWTAMCPVHEGDGGSHKPSLVVSEGDEQPVVLQCMRGCSTEGILSALDLNWADVTGGERREKQPERPRYAPPADLESRVSAWQEALFSGMSDQGFLIAKKHLARATILEAQLGWDAERKGYTIPVRDAKGELLFVKHYFPGQEKKYDAPAGTRTCLFGEEQLAALPKYGLVVVTEGELDSLAVRSIGIPAVSGTGGAGTWREEWSQALRTFEVVVIGDNDAAGLAFSEKALKSLRAAGAYAQPLEWPPNTPPKFDPCDCAPDLLGELIRAAQQAGKFRSIDMSSVMRDELEPIPWMVTGLMARGDIVLLGGEPGTGKSILCMELALALALGEPVMGSLQVPCGPQRVLYIDEENNRMLAKRRLRTLLGGRGITDPARLPILYLIENSINLDNDGMCALLEREMEAFRPDCVILDSLVRFHRRDENSNSEMSKLFSERFRPLTKKHGCSIVLLHHLSKPNKQGSSEVKHRMRGASDLSAMVDEIWALEGDAKTPERTLKHEKCRWSETILPLILHYAESDDHSEATLTCSEESHEASNTLLAILIERGTEGSLRQDLIASLERSGLQRDTARRAADRQLRRLEAQRLVASSKEGHQIRYWHCKSAPKRVA
jgi:hypothetical protein